MILLVMNALISYALTGKQAGGSLALQNVWTLLAFCGILQHLADLAYAFPRRPDAW